MKPTEAQADALMLKIMKMLAVEIGRKGTARGLSQLAEMLAVMPLR